MNFKFRTLAGILASALALTLASCGGGGGGGSSSSVVTPTASVSTGAVTAFGSVFVNGHEFNTTNAAVIDDDTNTTTTGTATLDVGMVVTVHSASGSTQTAPVAADIHVSPLARGFVDASDSTAGTITVMGQSVELTSSTVFVDHRACIAATPSTCTAISGQAGLATTSGATPGNYVAIHGYLFSGTAGTAQIVATLVSVGDYTSPTSTTAGSPFKLEGQVTAIAGTTLTIGGESVDLATATCTANGATAACTSTTFAVGNVVAARGFTAPASTTFTPATARLSRLLPQTAGTTVEVEGKVSSVSVSGMTFVIRGITIDGSALTTLPALGDRVELLGTIAADGTTVKATTIEHDLPAAAPRVVLAGPLSSVSAGTTAGTFTVTVLGQTATVSATTHIADRTATPPYTFNITNFQTYLGTFGQFVLVRSVVDSSGNLQVTGFDVVRALPNNLVAVAGPAAAIPTLGTPNSVSVHGVSVLYTAVSFPPSATIAAGTNLLGVGTLSSGSIDTTATGGGLFVLPDHDRGFRGF